VVCEFNCCGLRNFGVGVVGSGIQLCRYERLGVRELNVGGNRDLGFANSTVAKLALSGLGSGLWRGLISKKN